MRIYFISNYSQLFGANRSLLTLIKYFKKIDYQVKVLVPSKGSILSKLSDNNIPYDIIPYYSSFLYFKLKFKYLIVPFLAILDLLMFPIIIYRIHKFRPTIIYSNTSAENIGIIIAKILGVKHISHIREFMSHDHDSYFIFGNHLKSKYISLSDGVIFVSNAVKKEILKHSKKFTQSTVIYNGIESSLSVIDKLDVPQYPNFGIVGLLSEGKGQIIAIKYFKQLLSYHPNSKLHIFGDKEGRYKTRIIKLISDLKIEESVIFHGFIENQNDIYKEFDILLMFSKSEGFGRVTVEAMLQGKPVIGFENAGTLELIKHEKTGFLFKNEKSFYYCVDKILSSNSLYNSIRLNAFAHIKSLCDEETYCKKVESFIKEIANQDFKA